jgi:hypothetical protein
VGEFIELVVKRRLRVVKGALGEPVLPYAPDRPTIGIQGDLLCPVSDNVSRDLGRPVFGIGRRCASRSNLARSATLSQNGV